MFVVTEADAAAIRAVYQQRGEFSAALPMRPVQPLHAAVTAGALTEAGLLKARPSGQRGSAA